MPIIHFSPFSPPRKRLRFPSHMEFPLDGHFPMRYNPLRPSSSSAGIQGARHAQFGVSISDLRLNNKLQQSGLFLSNLSGFQRFDPSSRVPEGILPSDNAIGNSDQKKSGKKHQFLLFGQLILTEQQISESSLSTGHCKVFMESEDVGRTLDLSALGSYDELYRRLANMFGLDTLELPSHVLYRDASGTVRRTGDEPFR